MPEPNSLYPKLNSQDAEAAFFQEKKDSFESELGIKNADNWSPDELYDELIKRVRKYHPSGDITLIEKAYKIAKEAHSDQKRKSGEPYIIHPLCVAMILADLELDKETIVAGLLHDIVEDTSITTEELKKEFGEEIVLIVDGVTKLGKLSYSADKLDSQAENLRKMFMAMAKDIRVILVKLADRLHNMRTLQYMSPEKQKEKSLETFDIYAPIAQRLGISKLTIEIEDLSMKYLKPEEYEDIEAKIRQSSDERKEFVMGIIAEVKECMNKAGIEARVDGRVKHFFSIYRKMIRQDKTIDEIYDLFAVRVIVKTVKDCYAALGLIHEMYTPIPGRFKDYIAMPKQNMYQSLHTTLISHTGTPFEIQIRTYDMHKIAERGIAAHWKYKEGAGGKIDAEEEAKINWLRQILEWQKDMTDNKEFMTLLKSDFDLYAGKVYCFSPAGEIKTLPQGACTIDFAYAVHSGVGNSMVGARVNGKLVPIETTLKNGDRVEIITSQNSRGPSRDWLKVVKSTLAKNRINQWFRNEYKAENIAKGRELLSAYAKAKGVNINDYYQPEYIEAVLKKYGFIEWDAVLAAVGNGGLREGQVFNKLAETYEKKNNVSISDKDVLDSVNDKTAAKPGNNHGDIIIDGMDDMSVRFSKCCSPIPGDDIIGFITRGRGVTIHRSDCVNVTNLPEEERKRLIAAKWSMSSESKSRYLVEILIFANNRTGLLVDCSKVLSEMKIDIISLNVRTSKHNTATIDTSFMVKSRRELGSIVDKMKQIEGIIDVERTRG